MSVHSESYEVLVSQLIEKINNILTDNGRNKDIKKMVIPNIVYKKIKTTTFGRCQYNTKTNECTIILNSRYTDKYPKLYLENTIPHKIGHAIDFTYNKRALLKGYRSHGATFKKIGRILGYEFTTRIDSSLYGVVLDEKPTRKLKRYVLKCSCCDAEHLTTKSYVTNYKTKGAIYRHNPEFCSSERGGLFLPTGEIRIVQK